MTGRVVLVIGTVGAEPDALAEALEERIPGRVVTGDADGARSAGVDVAVVGLDPSIAAADEERELLDTLAESGVPTALAVCCADRHPHWPEYATAARRLLDPEGDLAMFAVAVRGDGVADGVDELARWCTEVPADHSLPRSRPPSAEPGQPDPAPGAEPDGAVFRADRLNGLRAGTLAARADVVTAAREAMQELAVTADRVAARVRVNGTAAYAAWLTAAVDGVARRAEELLADRLDHVRAVAVVGLADTRPADRQSVPAAAVNETTVAAPPPVPRGASESAMLLVLGASAGYGVGRVLLAPAAALVGIGWVGTAAAVVCGLAVAVWVAAVRRTAEVRSSLRRWSADTVALSRTALDHRLSAAVGAVETHAGREVWNRTAAQRV